MTGRRATFLTARRELRERVRSRAFVISTAIQVVVVVAIVVISGLTSSDTESFTIGAVGEGEAIAEAAEQQQDAFGVEIEVETFSDEDEARAAVDDDEVDAAVTDGELIVRTDPSETLVALIQQSARDLAGTQTLSEAGLDDSQIQSALNPPPLEVSELGEEAGSGIAFVSSLLLYIAIIGSGYAVATGVVEEKATRVVEVVLSAIKPVHLLAGKVLGIGLMSLGQLLIIVAAGLAAAIPTGAIDLPDSTGSTAILVGVYFALGYVVYACAFAVSGAIVSRQEDVQNSTSPIMVLLIAAYLVGISAANSPDSPLAVIASFVPPLAPMIVPARAAQDALPAGELVLSLVLMFAMAALLIWIAARVYDRSVLRMGAPVKFAEAIRSALRRGEQTVSR